MDMDFETAQSLSSLQSEYSVLGALLLDNRALENCEGLTADMFSSPANAMIYRAIDDMICAGQTADVVTVDETLTARGQSAMTGGLGFLVDLNRNTPSARNIGGYVRAVREKHLERELLRAGEAIVELAVERDGRNIAERQAQAQSLLMGIEACATGHSKEMSASEAMFELDQRMKARQDKPEGYIAGLKTGLRKLDAALDGLQNGDLIVIGARPSMGKSVLGEMICRTNARTGKAVRLQSYEMPARDIIMRSCAAQMGIDVSHIRLSRFEKHELEAYQEFHRKIAGYNWVIDGDGVSVDTVIARAKRQKRTAGLDLLVIDHLHIMPRPGRNTQQEYAEITRKLKQFALGMDIPVVLLAQLNRAVAVDRKTISEPRMTDLRDSGSIEQDADVIVMPHRDSYYNHELNPNKALLLIEKNRNGERGRVECGWQGKHVRFVDEPDFWMASADKSEESRQKVSYESPL